MFRNLLALIGLAFVLFVVVGFTMKWYTFSREDGKLTVHIFTDKVEEGLQKIKDGAIEFKDNATKALSKPKDEKAKAEPAPFGGFFGPAAAAPKPNTNSTQLPPSGQ